MERKDYFTIKEYAESKGYTVQYVYQLLKKEDSELKDRITTVNGKKVIKKIKEEEEEKQQQEEPKEENENAEEQKTSSSNDIIDILKDEVEHLKKEIDEKNKQIERLQITLENNQHILHQSQKLLLIGNNEEGENGEPKTKKHKFLWFLNKPTKDE